MKLVQMCAASACALVLFLPASAEAKIAGISTESSTGLAFDWQDLRKAGSFTLARRGADDPPGDDRGGTRGGGGADDPRGDDRGGTRNAPALESFDIARRGADDPPGDDRGGTRGGGGGADDPPGDDRGGTRLLNGLLTGTV